MQTAARAGASGSACGSRRAPTGPARTGCPGAKADTGRGMSPQRAYALPPLPVPHLLGAPWQQGSAPRRFSRALLRALARRQGETPHPGLCRRPAGKAQRAPSRRARSPCRAERGGYRPRPAGPRQPLRPGRWDKGTQQRAGVGGNDPGAHARRALQRCMTRALQHHQQPGSRSHRLPAPGRRAPAAELFLVRSRGRARRRWHRRLLSARAARRTPLLAVSCSRGAPRPWRARAARASRSVFSVRPRLRYAAAGSCSCLLTALPRSARPGVCPRPAPSATAARAPPPAPALG